jgi:hypothetical protein
VLFVVQPLARVPKSIRALAHPVAGAQVILPLAFVHFHRVWVHRLLLLGLAIGPGLLLRLLGVILRSATECAATGAETGCPGGDDPLVDVASGMLLPNPKVVENGCRKKDFKGERGRKYSALFFMANDRSERERRLFCGAAQALSTKPPRAASEMQEKDDELKQLMISIIIKISCHKFYPTLFLFFSVPGVTSARVIRRVHCSRNLIVEHGTAVVGVA